MDQGNLVVRCLAPDGTISTVAGGPGQWGYRDGPAAEARFTPCNGIAFDASGVLYVADTMNHPIRRVDPGGNVTTVAGNGQASLLTSIGLALLPQERIRALRSRPTPRASPSASCPPISPSRRPSAPSTGTAVPPSRPPSGRRAPWPSIPRDAWSSRDPYNHRIRRLEDGKVVTIAGKGGNLLDAAPEALLGDGLDAREVRLYLPARLAIAPDGRVFFSELASVAIRWIATDGTLHTLAPPPLAGRPGAADAPQPHRGRRAGGAPRRDREPDRGPAPPALDDPDIRRCRMCASRKTGPSAT